jgi:hypothetical protein
MVPDVVSRDNCGHHALALIWSQVHEETASAEDDLADVQFDCRFECARCATSLQQWFANRWSWNRRQVNTIRHHSPFEHQ